MQNDFTLIRSRRKTVAIQIMPDLSILVRAPGKMPISRIREFIAQKERWITSSRQRMKSISASMPADKLTPEEIQHLKQQAAVDLTARTEHFAKCLHVNFGKITVRCQTSRWGSCSGEGNLSFNCLLMFMPEAIRDYVVVHELCHRKHMNHSPAFWNTVAEILPDYRQSKSWLKENGFSLIARIK